MINSNVATVSRDRAVSIHLNIQEEFFLVAEKVYKRNVNYSCTHKNQELYLCILMVLENENEKFEQIFTNRSLFY